MDGPESLTVSAQALYARLGTAAAPILVDARRADAFDADDEMIAGAVRRPPTDMDRWRRSLPQGRSVVVYCGDGAQTSQAIAAALRKAEWDARYLEGGIALWRDLSLPTRRRIGPSPGRWVTRERPKVDRIACPWLVSRFIDPEAEFLYVPGTAVREVAAATGATPFDIAGVEFGHVGEQCSFDAFIRIFGINDAALDRLALIVRGADTGMPNLTPQSPGLIALVQGLSANFLDDHEMLAHGMVLYDALYAWCRIQASSFPRTP